MTRDTYQSWGRLPFDRQTAIEVADRSASLPHIEGKTFLPYGNGRSYGDSCLNEGGVLLDCRGLNRVIAFDSEQGVLRCEAGMLISDILEMIVPAGWFLPVTPGTKFVTVGGAIANDVHGKNHHVRGTFGCHVRSFELLRTDGRRLSCSPRDNAEWFGATIGGLGLTGLITWAEIQLMPIGSAAIDQETIRFGSLDEFVALSEESDATFEYSVAWVDSLASGDALGRGLFIRGNHANDPDVSRPRRSQPRISVPFAMPVSLVNRASLTLFNAAYYRKQLRKAHCARVHYDPFFYPLDSIGGWNKLYGPSGMLQHQCLVPMDGGVETISRMLRHSQKAGMGSFLTVLKAFGDVPSPGLLSFPQPGLTLTLDFPNGGAKTRALLQDLDDMVRQVSGRVNPYKDASMSAESYQAFFPNWQQLIPFIDPAFSSSFWRRVTDAENPADAKSPDHEPVAMERAS